ncbi:hypothetical protein [Pedobacter frigiditerrae]|uniref:hypothetical protein n=1 Tax=Pedobacter frigiditerrae TaxID=2530452 RepID=UPI0029319FE2|nr:hypothetical protein [Pedobacter frigiditerrae]
MITIGFVIAFRPKKNSKDWEHDSKLLYSTITSIKSQKLQDFKIYIIYHDLPTIIFEAENISYIKFPFSFLNIEEIENSNPINEADAKALTYFFDQGKKIMYGAAIAKIDHCKYIMSVDSDDLVSNRIVDFLASNNSRHGWYVNSGYIYYTEKKLLLYREKDMNGLNGSTNIINSNDVPDVDFENNDVYNFNFFAAHGYLKVRLMKQGKILLPLPFPAIVYKAHTSNWFGIHKTINKKSIRNFIKIILFKRKLTKSIIEEFKLS